MKGIILCTRCRKKMKKGVCECGNHKCLISIYRKGKHYEYRRDNDGDILTYEKALKRLIDISHAMKTNTFNPFDYSDNAIQERKFELQIEKWLDAKREEVSSNELAPETFRCYRSYERNYFKFFNGRDVRDIEFADLENFKDTLKQVKVKTRKNILNALKSFFMWMKKRGVIRELPVFPEVKGDDSSIRIALDIEDQLAALNNIPIGHRDIIEFMFETGLRPGEACAVKIKDIDLKNRQLLVQRTYSGDILKETTKGKNKKWIPLSDRAFQIVLNNIKQRFDDDFIFINPVTKRGYRQEFIRRIWRRHSGLDVTLYEASRHSFCTQIAQSGLCNTLQAKLLMRHADIRSTERYFHGSVVKLRDIVNMRGNVFVLEQLKSGIETK
ncbi:MAG: tyrosine-type recombinase/integrase [Syntrophorhabdaceae bacterium]|nr:tyrosine-type recombinase/integrase [Syntrophorhabdaceae bacterium]